MQITRSGEYGLRGLLFLAKRPPEKVTLVSEISRDQNIPETFLAKIFRGFLRLGCCGPFGGAFLSGDPLMKLQ
jgi:DNA-binding IscR family transcriptional regulator